ncbi:hypothetical protein UlMin_002282 [Ulmus minor]
MTFKNLSFFYFFSIPILISGSRGLAQAIRLDIQNNCLETVWAAAVPGGGKRLNNGETWTLDVKPGPINASIWARTNCNFDGAGRGNCESGDCGGLLECRAKGQPPYTLAELALNQYENFDRFGISLLNGFNVPIEFSPTSENCSKTSKCVGDVNGPCPQELRDPGGCNNPCTVFRNDQFCCSSGTLLCEATNYSKFFKAICPDALTYPMDDDWSSFKYCLSGTNYKVVFCPNVSSDTAIFQITNSCPFVVWPAALPGGGRQLKPGETWDLSVANGTGRIWARTGCEFDSAGRGKCETGDCGGVLQCQSGGQPPYTLAEYSVNTTTKNRDYFDISLVDGFNVGMDFSPTSIECTSGTKCVANITDQCPNQLKAPGGCNNPCMVYQTDEYCCTHSRNCTSTSLSRFFKERCPDAYSYPYDYDKISTFRCPSGTNYKVVFCAN